MITEFNPSNPQSTVEVADNGLDTVFPPGVNVTLLALIEFNHKLPAESTVNLTFPLIFGFVLISP